MPFTAELSFFRRLMKNSHIDTHIIPNGEPVPVQIDRGLRDFLKMQDDYAHTFGSFFESLDKGKIYSIKDGFYCCYIFMLLPDNSLLAAGPYLNGELTHQRISEAAERYGIPQSISAQMIKYYGNLTRADEKNLFILCSTLGESVWGSAHKPEIESINLSAPEKTEYDEQRFSAKNEDSLLSIQILEERYAAEARMMQAVSQGMTHKVEQLFGRASGFVFEKRAEDPVRNMKNYLIISNTLMRKAAEYGSVHPFYIDGLSSDFAVKIEKVRSVSEANDLMYEMVRRYCSLVKMHSMKDYSLLVQRVLTAVDSDLTADLGLKRIASHLNVNASYLSSLFRKETGRTLTEYVNRKRIDHAAYLLRTTDLQVQTVAQQCGIFDVNYFAKMFKKYTGKTPKTYREEK